MRGHTLVWHSQTPDWFFRYGYNANNAYVDQNTMNKRMEFFIKTYMGFKSIFKRCLCLGCCK